MSRVVWFDSINDYPSVCDRQVTRQGWISSPYVGMSFILRQLPAALSEGPLYIINQTLTVMIMMLNDCVCLQVLDGSVKEYRSGTGGLWGSSEEDNRFVHFLWSTTTFYASNSFCRVLLYLLVFLLNSVSNTFLFAEGNTCGEKIPICALSVKMTTADVSGTVLAQKEWI